MAMVPNGPNAVASLPSATWLRLRCPAMSTFLSVMIIRNAFSLQMWSGLSATSRAAPRPRVDVGAGALGRARPFSVRRSNIVMMPEGPEVRNLVDQLQPAVGMRLVDFRFLSGRYVHHGRPKGFEEFARTMTPRSNKLTPEVEDFQAGIKYDGRIDDVDVITKLTCKGKFIYVVLDQGRRMPGMEGSSEYQRSIWITLGMTGQFSSEEDVANRQPVASNEDKPRSGPRWYMELVDTKTKQSRKIYYRDTRNFGTLRFCLSAVELKDKLASLGPDLLDFENTTEEVFLASMEKSTQGRNICKFLMDQGKLAGVGNYILAEGLYRSRLDPFASLSEIRTGQRKRLFKELREIALTSYQAQGLTRPDGGTYRGLDGSRGEFEFQLQCYGQRVSPNNFPVTKEVNGPHGRTIWYVEDEQLFVPRSQRGQKADAGDGGEASMSSDGFENGPSYVLSGSPDQLTDSGWRSSLSEHMGSESFQSLRSRIQADANAGATIYPPASDIFSALNLCPLEKVKCVIVGQDPYHQPGQGHGLAFSVRKGVKPPPSLLNIFKEAMADVGIDRPRHGNLEGWARQGVLLLNSVMTVRRGEANSHAKMGWEEFTDSVLDAVNEREDGVVFLLWGGPAAKKARRIDRSKHSVIRASHPSPLGATKTATPFLSSRCFSRANEALIAAGKDAIDWNVI